MRAYKRTLLSWGIMGEVDDIESYLLHGKYPRDIYTEGEKASLQRKCRDNKIEAGILRT